MLTRLRVRGFKNLYDVEVRLGPFTCVAGKNAVGKSNIFDAIQFLHLLTKHSIMEAAQLVREAKSGHPDPKSLFTTFGLFRAPEMRFEADLLLDRAVEDDFGVSAKASISSVRYELAFRLNQDERPERLELIHESLLPVAQNLSRRWIKFTSTPDFIRSITSGVRSRPFISTQESSSGPQIKVHQEGHGGRTVPAPKSSLTVLGGTNLSDFPTVLAARREMESWQTLMLEPSAMRAPSTYRDSNIIDSRGGNLPAAIERLEKSEEREGQVCAQIANRLSDLIDDVRTIRIRDDETTETWTVEVQSRDGTFHPARSLSDGTLRFLVLATLGIDPLPRGVISLEEPENGMHPDRVPAMLRLLRDIAVDADLAVGDENPLRQVLVNTHSPVVIKNVRPEELIYVKEQNAVFGNARARVALITAPKDTWRTADPQTIETANGDLAPYDTVSTPPQMSLALGR